jgi:hypothetical protein
MSKRLEKGFFDRLLNAKFYGKRKLGLPLKYYYETQTMTKHGRFKDMLYFPKNNFEKFIGNCYERIMPGLKYFFWDEHVKWARHHGWTLGEALFHNFRFSPFIQMHGMCQLIHPYGWLEGQRRDAFERKVDGMMPGIKVPDWSHETRRVNDYDYNSIRVPSEVITHILRESTPLQHLNRSLHFSPFHYFRQANFAGYVGQRLFYNEDLRGDYYSNGLKTEGDKKIIHGWYADAQPDNFKDRVGNMTLTEKEFHNKNIDRWNANWREFYPELHVVKSNPVLHKYEEAHYERNMEDIRSAIFTKQWVDNADKFSQNEIQEIYEFFCMENTAAFFDMTNPHEEAQPTELYTKFIEILGFPDFFKIDRYTTYPPEKQFTDLMDFNWGIDFSRVDSYSSQYIQLIKNSQDSEAATLVKEELFNPYFRLSIQTKYNYNLSESESCVLHALENGVAVSELHELADTAREETYLTSSKVMKAMINSQVRKVIKTFQWKGQPL